MLKTDHTFHFNDAFELESGETLSSFQLKFTTVGNLNEERTNAVWVCHALTGSADFTDWWAGLFSPDGPFDPAKYFIICANILGGCYGSTGPLSNKPDSARAYYHDFPSLTNRDVVRAFDLLRLELKIKKIHTIIGGSLGGQQVLVGHSMGGLVSRATFVANPANVAALVTVGTPHEGTLLADNADKIITWLDNVRVRVGDAKAQFNSANRAEIDAFFTGGFATVEDFAMARFGIRCVFIVCKKT